MSGYLVSFTVYTMAMCGLIFFALFVYKKFAQGNLYSSSSKFLNIEDTLNIAPRKTLYVVRAGNEKFLIAGDIDKTSLIAKLGTNTNNTNTIMPAKEYENLNTKGVDDLPVIVDFPQNSASMPQTVKNIRRNPSSKNVIMDMVQKIKE